LAEIAGEWVHPVLGLRVKELAEAFRDTNGIRPVA